jgi:hypothetical protein
MNDPRSHGPTPECLSALAIDEWNAQDTPEELRADREAHLEECTQCAARVAAAAAEAEAFLQTAPSLDALVAAGAVGDASAPSAGAGTGAGGAKLLSFPRVAAMVGSGLAVAAGVMLLLRPADPAGSTRIKGGERLGVYVKRGDRVLRAADGDVVHPGDTLRFTYSADGPCHLSIWGADGHSLQQYHPAAGGAGSAAVPAGREQPLDFGVELDGSIGTETFYGVFCNTKMTSGALREGLAATPATVPDGCVLDVLSLKKGAAP